jgi:hypothetical protein
LYYLTASGMSDQLFDVFQEKKSGRVPFNVLASALYVYAFSIDSIISLLLLVFCVCVCVCVVADGVRVPWLIV